MNARASAAGHLARLLSWDAPFLPAVTELALTSVGLELACAAPGAELARAMCWPRGQRAAVALQIVAASSFLFERGWYPSRSLLRSARVSRSEDGVWLRLSRLPCRRLEDPGLERRLRLVLGPEDNLLVPVVAPLLRALLPERADELERATRMRPVWEAAAAWIEVLLAEGRGVIALRHPAGRGRALWARRFLVPAGGVFWVEEEGLLPGLVAAAWLAAGDTLAVADGAFEEADVARAQARAAADGHDCLVLTTLSLPGVPPLPLAGEADAVWVLAPPGAKAHTHEAAAVEAGGQRPSLARLVLEAGARTGFAGAPAQTLVEDREAFASAPARQALGWLESAPVGLTDQDMAGLAAVLPEALPELERLGLAQQHHGVWRALRNGVNADAEKLQAMACRLPDDSVAGMVARALAQGCWEPAAAWCEERLERGSTREVLEVARALARFVVLRVAAAEAALGLGRLKEAEGFLEGVAEDQRGPRWHAVAAWWAELAGVTERAAVEVAAVAVGVPGRLVARCELVAAELARRGGDRAAELEHLERAVAATEPALAEAELARAAWGGTEALRALRKARGAEWEDDLAARLLQLLGLAALDRGSCAAAGTALRAALRAASGDDLRLLGEIHADLGGTAILADQLAVADRHLLLAENLLERCGSRRSVTLVRANRAVLACDRLDWRTCRELNLAVRQERGAVDDSPTLLGELELARAELARGDVPAVQALLPGLEEAVERHGSHASLHQTLAALKAHVALALGDLERAKVEARGAEAGEKDLILALQRANEGNDPSSALPRRWGLAITARLLAAWRRDDEAAALARMERALERSPREASVGLARFAALLARGGQHLSARWTDLERRAEAALADAELEGWAGILRGACGLDPVRLLRALDGIVNAGTDALSATRLETLARALGLSRLEIVRGGARLGCWGEAEGEVSEFHADGILVRAGGVPHSAAEAALRLVARHIASRQDGGGLEVGTAGSDLLGTSAALQEVREQVARWAPLPLTVLVTGEPGTGKELVARELHRRSLRSGAFVPVNCAGIPAPLLEAELFGVVRGAFTGADRDRAGLVEAAEGGTLFLDEVGELPLELQGKLLRLLQEREVRRVGATRLRTVDVRFLAATNRDLTAAMATGSFRQDLYYRLAVAVIEVPPLRERPEDVEALARFFAHRFAATLNRPGVRLAPAALELLRQGPWPGNARELESAVARAVADARAGEVLGPDRFPGVVPGVPAARTLPAWPAALAQFRRAYFSAVLRETAGNRTQAARRAGVSRQTLLYHLRALDLRDHDEG